MEILFWALGGYLAGKLLTDFGWILFTRIRDRKRSNAFDCAYQPNKPVIGTVGTNGEIDRTGELLSQLELRVQTLRGSFPENPEQDIAHLANP
jgi:hypothetical protein